jgi:hypothetical protein
MAHAMVQGGGRLMAGPREFETFYAASYRRLVTQLLGVTGNLHDLAVSAARRSRRFLAAAARPSTAAPAAPAASPPSSRSRPAPPGTSSSTPPAAGRPRR